jgi:predicted nucleic acid-binding protein
LKYLLDTNTVSALMRGDEEPLARLQKTNRRDIGLPHPVVAEIAYGIARLPKSKKRKLLEERFELLAETFARVEWTDTVSSIFGQLKASLERRGLRIEDFDVAIAAHALASGCTLVTANLKHMANVPDLVVENWSSPRVRE